jgi:hypothetical protein
LGTPKSIKVARIAFGVVFTISIFLVSFGGIWGIQLFERYRNDWVKSECNGEDNFKIKVAFDDFMQPKHL